MPSYELTYVLRPLDDTALAAINERINTLIANSGGQLIARNDWGKRRLAYTVKNLTEGIYSTLQLNLPPQAVRPIERALQLNDDVLRYLVIRVEEVTPPPATPAPAAPQEAQKETT